MSTNNDDPAGACRPFDKDRDGFVFGEAGALMVIETEELAGLKPSDIDHVNAHATGTSVGDVAEGQAINKAMGGHRPAVYAPKSALGHSVGAVGAAMGRSA